MRSSQYLEQEFHGHNGDLEVVAWRRRVSMPPIIPKEQLGNDGFIGLTCEWIAAQDLRSEEGVTKQRWLS